MKKNKLLLISLSSVMVLSSCKSPIQFLKDLFAKKKNNQQESQERRDEEGTISDSFVVNAIKANFAGMKNFSLTMDQDIDFKADMEFMDSGKNAVHRLKESGRASLKADDMTLELSTSSSETREAILSDFATMAGMSVEEVVSGKEMLEDNLDCTITIDQPNNQITLLESSNIAIDRAFDQAANQYYMLVNLGDVTHGEYLLDSELGEDDILGGFTDGIAEFVSTIEDGTYNAETGILTKTFAEPYKMDSDTKLDKVEVKVRDNIITELKGYVNVAASYECTPIEVNKAEISYKFSNINSTVPEVGAPSFACTTHKKTNYECLPNGHRPYCGECHKYIGVLEEHHHNDHNFCEVCRGLYDVSEYLPTGFTSSTGEQFVKFKKANNSDEVFLDGFNYTLKYESKYENSKQYNVYVSEGVIITRDTTPSEYFIEGHCSTVSTYTYSLYNGIVISKDADNKLAYDGYDKITDALASKTPIVVAATCFEFSHEHTTHTELVLDDCHTKHTYVCDRCHETTKVEIERHHTDETWSIVNEADLLFKPEYKRDMYLKSECSHCHEVTYYGIGTNYVYDHADYSVSAYEYDTETGEVIAYPSINVPHMFDEHSECLICGATKYELGDLVFLVEYNWNNQKVVRTPSYNGVEIPSSNYSTQYDIIDEKQVTTISYYDRSSSDPDKVLLGQKVTYFKDQYGSEVDHVVISGGEESVTITGNISAY